MPALHYCLQTWQRGLRICLPQSSTDTFRLPLHGSTPSKAIADGVQEVAIEAVEHVTAKHICTAHIFLVLENVQTHAFRLLAATNAPGCAERPICMAVWVTWTYPPC